MAAQHLAEGAEATAELYVHVSLCAYFKTTSRKHLLRMLALSEHILHVQDLVLAATSAVDNSNSSCASINLLYELC